MLIDLIIQFVCLRHDSSRAAATVEGSDKRKREGGAHQQQQQQRPPGPRPVLPGAAKEHTPQPARLHQRAVHESQERSVSPSLLQKAFYMIQTSFSFLFCLNACVTSFACSHNAKSCK